MTNNWSKLTNLQLGRYGEYFAKMEFTKVGFDVYTAEVDDKGIDFVARKSEIEYYDIQVKSIRNHNYVYMTKGVFKPRKNLLLVLALFEDYKAPTLLLIPSMDYINKIDKPLVDRGYEWGISIAKKNIAKFLSTYEFDKQISQL